MDASVGIQARRERQKQILRCAQDDKSKGKKAEDRPLTPKGRAPAKTKADPFVAALLRMTTKGDGIGNSNGTGTGKDTGKGNGNDDGAAGSWERSLPLRG